MPAIDTDVPSVQRMFDVNLFGPMRMVHHFHDLLIRAMGTVVNMRSIGGVVPYVYGASYNASKAALAHWSNTLRVEMEPFGYVTLYSIEEPFIISGEVSTNILRNDHGRTLPEDSYYAPLASEFKDHLYRTPEGATDRHAFATKAVAQALRSSPPAWFWTGSWATFIWALDTFFPRRVLYLAVLFLLFHPVLVYSSLLASFPITLSWSFLVYIVVVIAGEVTFIGVHRHSYYLPIIGWDLVLRFQLGMDTRGPDPDSLP
ncbi:hypothetical protein ASPCAL03073 [Aspergillus calidoustus]|uniref:Uncharacterized protein n=1 Tax=Aspergillus calidoustus TaxID=454130 RepID=A0A0U4ZXA4_ASPCI|nr:hypothetical protein ASPCAL03073 [Aspergillus calidoustus]